MVEVFDYEDYPFQEDWLKMEEQHFQLKTKEEWDEDDEDPYALNPYWMKTHPDIEERQEELLIKLEELKSQKGTVFVQSATTFKEIVDKADFEFINNQFFLGHIDYCLFNTLQLLQKYPDNAYLHAMVGRCWTQMAKAQKDHQLMKYINAPHIFYDDNFNQLLNLFQNLNLSEIEAIGYAYLKKHNRFIDDEHYIFAVIESVKVTEKNKTKLTKKYMDLYPEGLYIREVKALK